MTSTFKRAVLAVAAAVAIAVIAVLVYGSGAPPSTEPGQTVQALVTGQMANFTSAEGARPAIEVHFTDGEAQPLTLAAFRGKVVLVNFWATWCAPCVREMPALDRLQAELGGADFQVVALAQERRGLDSVKRFIKKHGIAALDIYVDKSSKSSRAFAVIGLPTSVVLDRDGTELGRLVGPAEWDSAEAVALIRHYIAATAG